jgi:ATP-dependent protease ClpP protease subunit
LYGDIGERYGGITPDDFRRALEPIPDGQAIELHVNSEGGDFTDGVAMFSILVRRSGRKVGIVDGLAASAATLPLMACDTVEVGEGSYVMIHEVAASMTGFQREEDFRWAAERLANDNDALVKIYMRRWKGTEAELRDALARETWFTAERAVEMGLADSVNGAMKAVAAHLVNRSRFKNTPSQLMVAARAAASVGELLLETKLHRAICV